LKAENLKITEKGDKEMLLSKANLLSHLIMKKDGKSTFHILPDGGTLATDTKNLIHVSPVEVDEIDFPIMGGMKVTLDAPLFVPKGTVEKALKTIPKKIPVSILSNCLLEQDVTTGRKYLVSTDLDTETRVWLPEDNGGRTCYSDWKKLISAETPDFAAEIPMSIKSVSALLGIIAKAFPENEAVSITQQGIDKPVILRAKCPDTGQTMTTLAMPMGKG
jgi:hypothetical protein